jgi:hypothetical protein
MNYLNNENFSLFIALIFVIYFLIKESKNNHFMKRIFSIIILVFVFQIIFVSNTIAATSMLELSNFEQKVDNELTLKERIQIFKEKKSQNMNN